MENKDFDLSLNKFIKEGNEVITSYFTKNFKKSWGKLKAFDDGKLMKITLKEGLIIKVWAYVEKDTGNIFTKISNENDAPGKVIRGNIFEKDTYINRLGVYSYKR